MRVILAENAGFCFGVDRAINIALKAGKSGKSATLGPIIHNSAVVKMLQENSVREVNSIEELEHGETAIICSHGAPKRIYDELESREIKYIDATCPYVKRIHNIVASESREGRQVVIFGDREHTEVVGIAGWCDHPVIIGSNEELKELENYISDREKSLSVVSQTTSSGIFWEERIKFLKKEYTNVKKFDTICNATTFRQRDAAELSAGCDAMVVIGDRRSANTRRLYEICKGICANVWHIENADELVSSEFKNFSSVGITAGASTPKWIIEEVMRKMSEEVKNNEVETESFAELLEQSIKTLNTGDKVTGIITSVSGTELQVDLGTKHAGYIPYSEISDDPTVKLEEMFKPGDEIEAYVVRVNDVEGTAMLSKKRLDTVKGWEEVEAAVESKETLEGIVIEENKGGVVASVKGVRVFIPSSQTGVPKDSPLSVLLKTKVKLKITEVNRARRRVVGSIRAVNNELRRAAAEKIWETIEVGNKYTGVVKSLTSYGAFVDIGGVDGMVHISELSWQRVRHPSDVVSVGQTVEVHVIAVDKEKKKISLGIRNPEDNPWLKFMTNFQVGEVITAKVVKLMPFGAFAEILPGVDGLIHISQIADRRIGKPGDVLSEGQEVQCKITSVDEEKQKVWLSIRALNETAAGVSEQAQGADLHDEVVAVSEEGKLEISEDTGEQE